MFALNGDVSWKRAKRKGDLKDQEKANDYNHASYNDENFAHFSTL